MKIKGVGAVFRPLFATIAAIGSGAELRRRASGGLLWLGFGSTGAVRTSFGPRGPHQRSGAGLQAGS